MNRVLSSGDARRPSVRAAFRPSPQPRSEPLERRLLLTDFTVTTTADAGRGSLRQAILDANASFRSDVIRFAIPGSGVHTIVLELPLPADTGGLTIDGTTQPGYVRAPLIQLDGSATGPFADGVVLGASSTIKALAINHFAGNGVSLFARVATIADCYIGVDPSGDRPAGNSGDGISFVGPAITPVPQAPIISGNVISANGRNAVRLINGAPLIQNNVIGLNAAGTARLGNAADGLQLIGCYSTIGPLPYDSTNTGRNVISGNGGHGVHLIGGDLILRGNSIGTDSSGNTAIGNGGHGVFLEAATGTIGGGVRPQSGPTLGNLISGNRGHGVYALNVAAGQLSVAVRGNRIGTDAAGDLVNATMGNGGHGVAMVNVPNAVVGGEDELAPNTIAFNGGSGVFVSGQGPSSPTPTKVQVRRNSIFSNGQLGIDLAGPADLPSGVTPNDPGDADDGPNSLLNFPELLSARVRRSGGTPATVVALRVDPDRANSYRVEFFANPSSDPSGFGEGRMFVGDAIATVNKRPALFLVTIPTVPAGTVLTATLTDTSRGNTSEFSAPVTVTESVASQVLARAVMSGGVVPEKQALLPGQTGSIANIVTQARGITGVALDIADLALPELFTINDFSFRSLSADGSTWVPEFGGRTVTVARGAGVNGSDRVTVSFQTSSLYRWLEVTLKANERTGLARPDVFYFGALTGEAGDAATPLHVSAIDLAAVRRAVGTQVGPGGSPYDFNRDGVINATDVEIVRRNLGQRLIALVAPAAP